MDFPSGEKWGSLAVRSSAVVRIFAAPPPAGETAM